MWLAARLLVSGEKPSLIPCRIEDISESGARIRVEVFYVLPNRVFLVTDEGDTIYECNTAWQRAQEAGLMYVDLCTHDKRQALLHEMAIAERLGVI